MTQSRDLSSTQFLTNVRGGGERIVIIILVAKKSSANSEYNAASKQEQVFATVAPLVISFLDGVNVTLFAYGQVCLCLIRGLEAHAF